jgi:hypothetical protein
VVTNPAPDAINASFLGVGGLTQGDVIPAALFGKIQCTNNGTTTTCTCQTNPCPTISAVNQANFNNTADWMTLFYKEIQRSNVTIEYSSSGLGYAGNPNGPDLAPIVTVTLRNMTFTPLACELVGCSIAMPAFVASLTFEDGIGTESN